MLRANFRGSLAAAVAAVMIACGAQAASEGTPVPEFKVDPYWPKTLPNNWAIGEIAGIWVDNQDNVWVDQRPGTLTERETRGGTPNVPCCVAAPPIIEFSPAGDVIRAWGGPGQGYDWPSNEHGVTVDPEGNVWVLGNGGGPRGADGKPDRTKGDGMALKFTVDGKFLMQIGGRGTGNSLDTTRLNHAAKVVFDPKTKEAFIADGYGNHRVIVFDMDTGKFKRMWGAYGKPPTDDKDDGTDGAYPLNAPPKQFATVHCIMRSNDALLYVCDRQNNRVQVFKEDGTFVKEFLYPGKNDHFPGRVTDLGFWQDKNQSMLIINDGNTEAIHLVRRDDGKELMQFGRPGNYAGEFNRQHVLAADSHGDIFAGEAGAHRVQKFAPSVPPQK